MARTKRNFLRLPAAGVLARAGAILLMWAAASPLLHSGTITVQPVNVCSSAFETGVCGDASHQLYTSFTDAIWAQAGIEVDYLSWMYYTAADAVLGSTPVTAAEQLYVDESGLNLYYSFTMSLEAQNPLTIFLWFVPEIDWCGAPVSSGYVVYGCTTLSGPLVMISAATFSVHRYDTIAHELGHALGLPHCDAINNCYGLGKTDLMASGTMPRTVPTSLSQIGTVDRLSAEQIDIAGDSPFVATPEPGTLLLTSLGALGFLRRRSAPGRHVAAVEPQVHTVRRA